MDYAGIFTVPPPAAVALSVFQTATLFILVLLGLKAVGRRVFGELSPQDLIILLLISEACDLGLTDERAGYWGTVASVVTILLLGWFCEKVEPLRKLLESSPVVIYKNGRLDRRAMKKQMLDESDLATAAREYGLDSYREFETIILEGDGEITGTLPLQKVNRRQKPT
jgi:uncharacterized membrane protein YcaP (DUF421 family)